MKSKLTILCAGSVALVLALAGCSHNTNTASNASTTPAPVAVSGTLPTPKTPANQAAVQSIQNMQGVPDSVKQKMLADAKHG